MIYLFTRRRYRSRERDEPYRRPISPSSNVHPLHSISGYVPGHPHPRMFYPAPYMFPRPFMRFPPPGRPRFYTPDLYSADYPVPKERCLLLN